MMQVFLLRHGNTFNKGERVVRVGSKTNLPLTDRGLEQAREFGDYLQKANLIIDKIYAGPLLRHRQHSQTIAMCINFPTDQIIHNDCLQEIDYGEWEARSDDEIKEAGFADDLENWNKKTIWPPEGVWNETQAQLDARVSKFLTILKNQKNDELNIVVITSGGVLRSFHKQLIQDSNQAIDYDTKVSTGHVANVNLENNTWKINYWNQAPNKI